MMIRCRKLTGQHFSPQVRNGNGCHPGMSTELYYLPQVEDCDVITVVKPSLEAEAYLYKEGILHTGWTKCIREGRRYARK